MSGKNFDNILFEMLKECRTLPNFLDNIFGFLQRRTDFYHIAKDEHASIGLPDGLAEKLVRHTFLKFKPDKKYTSNDIPVSKEEVVAESSIDIDEVTSTTTEESTELTFTKSDYYNGGIFNNYCWSQTIKEVDVTVKVPQNINRKHLMVSILPTSISVQSKNEDYLLKGELCEKCKANDTVWSLDGQKLQIHLEKCREKWWTCLVKGETELDISKIDCSRPYEDLSEEEQAKIEELKWNQERKRLGLPTSEELKLHDTLKKSWDATGSPFRGPFDPNNVKLN
ncbi:nudC domain-containing protein 3 [Diorhabda sublineata]|uniref:nudC domain-containing protein 3 n=1 Tax=Diorhabda sublineata TaxID=1163346 RepID=UPI0024E113CF|nr:nudC domain-containing protein 3 [Diorhabda sublineata]